jgi:hypothetical protein
VTKLSLDAADGLFCGRLDDTDRDSSGVTAVRESVRVLRSVVADIGRYAARVRLCFAASSSRVFVLLLVLLAARLGLALEVVEESCVTTSLDRFFEATVLSPDMSIKTRARCR